MAGLIPYNTMGLRGTPPKNWKFSEQEIAMRKHTLHRGGAMPSWYYDDSYDEADPNAPTFYEAMLQGELR